MSDQDWRIGMRVKQKYAPPGLRSDGSYVALPWGKVVNVIKIREGEEKLVIELDSGQHHIDDPDNWITA